jgi:hypothetical protein
MLSVSISMFTQGVVISKELYRTGQVQDSTCRCALFLSAYLLTDFTDCCHTWLLLWLHASSRDNPSVWVATTAHEQHLKLQRSHKGLKIHKNTFIQSLNPQTLK